MKKFIIAFVLAVLLLPHRAEAQPIEQLVLTGLYVSDSVARFEYKVDHNIEAVNFNGSCLGIRGGWIKDNSFGEEEIIEGHYVRDLQNGMTIYTVSGRDFPKRIWIEFHFGGGTLFDHTRHSTFPARIQHADKQWEEVMVDQCDDSPVVLPLVFGSGAAFVIASVFIQIVKRVVK